MAGASHNNIPKLGLIFLGRKRPGFDPDWGKAMAEAVRAPLRAGPAPVFEPPVKVIDDASVREAVAACRAASVDVLIALQTTMADGRLAPTLCQLWADPIVLWATPEKPQGDMISSCSLVGAHAWASILRQMGRAFEIVAGDPEDGQTLAALHRAARVAYAAGRMRRCKAGLVGGAAPGFLAMAPDAAALQRALGLALQTYSLVEFIDAAKTLSADAVAEDVQRVLAMGLPMKDIAQDDLRMASRCYLAMRRLLDDEGLDALAVRCWPELPGALGQWPYVAMARLTEEGEAIGCEGDIDGAITCLIGKLLGAERGFLSDWLEHDRETIALWHGGLAPPSACPAQGEPGAPVLARHFNNGMPAVVEGALAANRPIALARLWRCDGEYWLTAREAVTVEPPRRLMGTNGRARLENGSPAEWFDELCHAGTPHHVAVLPGRCQDLLRRFARAMRIQWMA